MLSQPTRRSRLTSSSKALCIVTPSEMHLEPPSPLRGHSSASIGCPVIWSKHFRVELFCAEEQSETNRHLDLTIDKGDHDNAAVVKAVTDSVSELLNTHEPVENLEGYPLIRKVLHKYARPRLSQGFAHMEKMSVPNSKCEKIAELQSVQGTPPTVRLGACKKFMVAIYVQDLATLETEAILWLLGVVRTGMYIEVACTCPKQFAA
jgi:hypothetical protein